MTTSHEPGEPHRYRIECEVCGQPGMIRLSVEPQNAADRAAGVERIADDNGDELEHGAPDFPGQYERELDAPNHVAGEYRR